MECLHCYSVVLCFDQIYAVEEPRIVKHVTIPPTVFPKRTRLMPCKTCIVALEQIQTKPATSNEVCR